MSQIADQVITPILLLARGARGGINAGSRGAPLFMSVILMVGVTFTRQVAP